MFGKSTQIGLVSLFVVVATALGGCAESVGGTEPASFPVITRPAISLSRYSPPGVASDGLQVVKTESVASRDSKHQVHYVAQVR